ncbi:hypothetical protein V8G54_013756 [Vigna mungo]|uniref:Uncharacterized protein n=1 Tax=Vigna mungo TaxID=3915 RepID=A0AAQ3RYP3_VIGMU
MDYFQGIVCFGFHRFDHDKSQPGDISSGASRACLQSLKAEIVVGCSLASALYQIFIAWKKASAVACWYCNHNNNGLEKETQNQWFRVCHCESSKEIGDDRSQ